MADADPVLRPVDFDPFAPASARPARLPLTEPQAEIWTAAAMGREANCSYNQCFAFELRGVLRIESLRTALRQAIARHEALRAVIAPDGTGLEIRPPFSVEIPLVDLSELDPAAQAHELGALLEHECETPFDLAEGPLIRATVLRESADRHRFVLTAHHIVCDGWSSAVLFSDLGLLYAADCVGIPAQLGPAASFRDYIAEQTSPAQLAAATADEEYWAAQYPDGAPVLDLPLAGPRPRTKTYRSGQEHLTIGPERYTDLKAVGASAGATLFATLLAAFEVLVHGLSGQSDFVVGIPLAGQAGLDNSSLVAHCVNTVPLRARLDPDAPFAEHLRVVRQELVQAQRHSQATFGTIVRRLRLPRDPSRTPLVAITFTTDKIGAPFDFGDVVIASLTSPTSFSNFELGINLVDSGSEIVVECDYNSDLFDGPTVARWLSHYATVLDAIVARPDSPVGGLIVLDTADEQTISDDANADAHDPASVPSPELDSSTAGTPHVAPRTPTEVKIAELWADAIGVPSPGVDDDFFDAGGDSLKAAQIIAALRAAFGVDAGMRHLFERPTIAGLAEIVDALAVASAGTTRSAASEREEIEI
jgi:acyl carrier protein